MCCFIVREVSRKGLGNKTRCIAARDGMKALREIITMVLKGEGKGFMSGCYFVTSSLRKPTSPSKAMKCICSFNAAMTTSVAFTVTPATSAVSSFP